MTSDSTDALEQALALHAKPGRMSVLHDRPLPNAVLLLIRIAAGDVEAASDAAARTSEARKVVLEAAVLYIQHVLFHETADSYRLLGVRADTQGDAIKEHYRWLMRWLHPDRNPERWEVVYSERVNRAWNSLNSEQRRQDYDAQLHLHARAGNANPRIAPGRGLMPRARPVASRPLLSPRVVRWLPAIVLGSLAIVATIGLAAFYWVQRDERTRSLTASERLAMQGAIGDSSAQEAAIRERIAFDERVIALSQPVLPASRASAQAHPADAQTASPNGDYPEAPSASAVAETGPVVEDEASPASVIPSPPANPPKSVNPHQLVNDDTKIIGHDKVPLSAAKTSAGASVPATAVHPKALPAPKELIVSSLPSRSVPPAQATPDGGLKAASALTPAVTTANTAPVVDPASAATQASASIAPAEISPQSAATEVVREFEQAYASGDLSRMMRLFAPNAVNNRGGIGAIREDYDRLFHDSGVHELRLGELKWVVRPDRIIGSGGFIAQIRHNDEYLTRQVRGWIQIEAVPIDGSWKIQRLIHRNTE